MEGVGTKNKELVDVICQCTPQELMMMKAVIYSLIFRANFLQAYARKHHHDVIHDVKGETSFNFKKLLEHVLLGNRMPPCVVDAARVEIDANQLYRAGEGRLGTNDALLIDIVSQRSAEHLQAVSQSYSRMHHGHNIEQAIKHETSGDYQFALLSLCTPRPIWVAQRIHDSVYGLGSALHFYMSLYFQGTNDSLLVRQFCLNDKRILQLAAVEYRRMFSHDMEHDIHHDTSGDYKKLLIRLLH